MAVEDLDMIESPIYYRIRLVNPCREVAVFSEVLDGYSLSHELARSNHDDFIDRIVAREEETSRDRLLMLKLRLALQKPYK